jgi:hypothetical protein
MVGENLVLFASFRLPRSVCSASSSVGPDDFLSTRMAHEPGQPASQPLAFAAIGRDLPAKTQGWDGNCVIRDTCV